MNISEVMQLPEGGIVYSLRVFVKSASKLYENPSSFGNGSYTSQNVTLEDQTGSIPARVTNPEPPLTVGQTIVVNAYKDPKRGQLTGATFGYYKEAPQLKISGKAITMDGGQQPPFQPPAYPQALQMPPVVGGGAEPPVGWQGDFPARRPQEGQAAPTPHPTPAPAQNMAPTHVQTPNRGTAGANPYAMPEQEARARLVGAFKDFVEELGYDPRGLATIPPGVVEVCAAWSTSILIGIQRKDIRPDPLPAPAPLFSGDLDE